MDDTETLGILLSDTSITTIEHVLEINVEVTQRRI